MMTERKSASAWWLLGLYFVLWTVLPLLLSSSYPLDVPEGIYWGREWQWGYYKHPPLSSWVLYSFYAVFGHIGPYLLSQCTVALTLWLVYRFGLAVFDDHAYARERALTGALLTLGVFYYIWPSLEFNHNIAQMPVWAGLVYVFYLAVRRNRWRDWLIFGALAGAGMLVKYSVAVLLLTMVLYSLVTPYRRLWLTPKPWAALLLSALVFAPNVVWLVRHDWLPFHYADARAGEAESHGGRLKALKYLATQLLNHLPMVLILLATRTKLSRRPLHGVGLMWFMGVVPTAILVAVGLVFGVGLRDMWGMPMWGMSGLMAVSLMPDAVFAAKSAALRKGCLIWLALATVLMAGYVRFGAEIRHKPSRMDWPQAELARLSDTQWREVSRCPLDSISGTNWPVLLAASYSGFGPSVMISGSPAYSPWMTPQRLHEHGTLLLSQDDKPANVPLLDGLEQDNNLLVYQGDWQVAWPRLPEKVPLKIHWRAYVPKNCAVPAQDAAAVWHQKGA